MGVASKNKSSLAVMQRDVLAHVLTFLDVVGMGIFDLAVANKSDRDEWWLPALSWTDSMSLSCYMNNCTNCCCVIPRRTSWLGVLEWVQLRQVRILALTLPESSNVEEVCSKLSLLACPERIESMSFAGCSGVSLAALANLEHCPRLCVVSLAQTDVDDASLNALLASHRSLTDLDLSDCVQLTTVSLAQQGSLRNLCLHGCTWVGAAHLASLAATSRQTLIHLNLCRCQGVTDAGLAALKGHTRLASLCLSGLDLITDAGAAHLQALTSLEVLELGFCELLSPASIGAWLSRLPLLEILMLRGCSVGDEEMAVVAGLEHLRELDLCDCHEITDVAMALLANLQWLEEINLSHCGAVSGEGILLLGIAAPRLGQITVCNCDNLSDELVDTLEGYGVEVVTDGYGPEDEEEEEEDEEEEEEE